MEENRKKVDQQTTNEYESKFIPYAIAENKFNIEPDYF